MKKIEFIFIVLMPVIQSLSAQKVGLVLSGGGAPGIAHIGVIKALEANNIPIDYISGTSIGAIVGGMYVMGMTPDKMTEILKSEDFKHWISGKVESENVYFYRRADPKPGIINLQIQFNKRKTVNLEVKILPPNIVSSGQMNYAFVPLCAQANAVSGSNFDKLFVPFRCVASDVYDKKAVVFRQEVLGDAIRASMTFPFVFKPISIDNKLLFDGGIYNNFPTDIMRTDFKPDFTLGNVVAYNPPKAYEDDPIMQLQNMIITKTDYSIPQSEGLLLKFDLANMNVFDFSKVDELVKIGYDSVMKHIDEIKARIPRRVTVAEMTERRKKFRNRLPEIKFQHIDVEGVDSLQEKYIRQYFPKENQPFNQSQFKRSYYQLISDEGIEEVIPHAVYDSATGLFDLQLKVTIKQPLRLSLGGNISSSGFNQGYIGLNYQRLSDIAFTGILDAQLGQVYSGLAIETRVDMPSRNKWYLKVDGVLHRFNYTGGRSPFVFTQNEAYVKFCTGFPLTLKTRLELGIGTALQTDIYTEKSQYSTQNAFLKIESNTLNDRMYPNEGHLFTASFQNFMENNTAWVQIRAKEDKYIELLSWFTLGTYAEAVFSNRNFQSNYTATIIQSPAFQPTPFSRTVFNPAFSANKFAAVGLKPIFRLNDQLQLREEAYGFAPYQSILPSANNSAYYSKRFSSLQFMTETSFVYNFKLASAAFFANYATGQWNIGLNIGVQLFKPKFGE